MVFYRFLLYVLLLISGAETAIAIVPHHIVYRLDSRKIDEIVTVGGFMPRSDGVQDYDLTRHFIGESLTGHRSAFVSTSYMMSETIRWFSRLTPFINGVYDANSVYYIYAIRPSNTFYDVDLSLTTLRDSFDEDSWGYFSLDRLIRRFNDMHELVAENGISTNRIMAFARITGEMLNTYGLDDDSPLFTEMFWASRWTDNALYNQLYDDDVSSVLPYSHLGIPLGSITYAQLNNDSDEVPLTQTCEGVQQSMFKLSPNLQSCGKFEVKSMVYDKKTLTSFVALFFNYR